MTVLGTHPFCAISQKKKYNYCREKPGYNTDITSGQALRKLELE